MPLSMDADMVHAAASQLSCWALPLAAHKQAAEMQGCTWQLTVHACAGGPGRRVHCHRLRHHRADAVWALRLPVVRLAGGCCHNSGADAHQVNQQLLCCRSPLRRLPICFAGIPSPHQAQSSCTRHSSAHTKHSSAADSRILQREHGMDSPQACSMPRWAPICACPGVAAWPVLCQ